MPTQERCKGDDGESSSHSCDVHLYAGLEGVSPPDGRRVLGNPRDGRVQKLRQLLLLGRRGGSTAQRGLRRRGWWRASLLLAREQGLEVLQVFGVFVWRHRAVAVVAVAAGRTSVRSVDSIRRHHDSVVVRAAR